MRLRTLLIGSCAGLVGAATSLAPLAVHAAVGSSQLAVAPTGAIAFSSSVNPFGTGMSYQMLLVDPNGAVGSSAMSGVDTRQPWAAFFEIVPPGAAQADGTLLCASVANPTAWSFGSTGAAATREGAPVAAFDATCPDGSYHVEWDYLYTGWGWSTAEQTLSSVDDLNSVTWGFINGPTGSLHFSAPGFVVTTLHICGPRGCATDVQWQTVYPVVTGLVSVVTTS